MSAMDRRTKARPDRDPDAHAATVVSALASALAGVTLGATILSDAPPSGVGARPILSRTQILLPRSGLSGMAPDPSAGARQPADDLVRAIAAHAAAHLLFSEGERPVDGLKPMAIAILSAIEDARVEALLCARFPGVRRWFRHGAARSDANPAGSFADRVTRLGRALLDSELDDDDAWIGKARRLFAQCTQDCGLGDYWAFRRLGSVLANDLGQMRVRFNPAEYVVPLVYRDDNSYLWTDPAAAPLAVAPVMQAAAQNAASRSQSVSRPGSTPHHADTQAGLAPVHYPEWDYRSGLLRQGWVTVFEAAASILTPDDVPSDDRWYPRRATVRKLSAATHTRRRRQPDGDSLDLDAAIRNAIDRRRVGYSDERHYMRRSWHPQPVSLLVLLDLSASANDAAGADGSRVLDLAVKAALSLAQALAHGSSRVAVHGFCSNTRARVSYERFLDFGAALDASARVRLRCASARESTRMGAALRHARRLLAEETNARRMLVVLSDGVPSDIDVFDPHYLARDAARAVIDLRRAGVDVCCITPVPTQALTAREVFGPNNVLRVINARTLPVALSRFVSRRLAG